MLFLLEQKEYIKRSHEKIDTYLTLFKMGCPVLKSAIIMPNEKINQSMIDELHDYFKTVKVLIRYQYVHPCNTPIQGGNQYNLSLEEICPLQNNNTILWILEPSNRLTNDYGINLYFHFDECVIEVVGKGFDISDINRGQISPHQIIISELPIRTGLYNEWWKFLKFSFIDKMKYQQSKTMRLLKLSAMGYNVSNDIFNKEYKPLSIDMLEQLLRYVSTIYEHIDEKDYCVSCSIINGKYVFWDIQTPNGKNNIYGVK